MEQIGEPVRYMPKGIHLERKFSSISMGYEESNEEHLKTWQSTTDGAQLLKEEAILKQRLSSTIEQKQLLSGPGYNHAQVTRRSHASHFFALNLGLSLHSSRRRVKRR